MSKGSVGETRNQLHIALAVNYITAEEFNSINIKLEELGSRIGGFIMYLDKYRKNNNT